MEKILKLNDSLSSKTHRAIIKESLKNYDIKTYDKENFNEASNILDIIDQVNNKKKNAQKIKVSMDKGSPIIKLSNLPKDQESQEKLFDHISSNLKNKKIKISFHKTLNNNVSINLVHPNREKRVNTIFELYNS